MEDKWLCYTEDGSIGVGVRSILDLRSWFHNAEVPSCEVCNEAGLKVGVQCLSCYSCLHYLDFLGLMGISVCGIVYVFPKA